MSAIISRAVPVQRFFVMGAFDPIPQTENLRPRVAKAILLTHTARKWPSWDLN